MRSAEVKALIQQTGAGARLRRSIDVEAPTPASPSVLNAKACGAKSTLRATLLLAALAATVRNAKAYGALSRLPAPVLLAAPAAAVRNAKVCSVPSTLRAPSCWQRLRSAKVWIATPYRLDAAANTLAHTPLPRGTAYVLMSGISLALLALR